MFFDWLKYEQKCLAVLFIFRIIVNFIVGKANLINSSGGNQSISNGEVDTG